MHRSIRWLVVLLVLAACRSTRSETNRADGLDSAARVGGGGLQDREPGVEYEAPRLIPAIRAQITEIEDRNGAKEGNLIALRNGIGTLVNAMETDLHRVGARDDGTFAALSDSIMREFGGAGDEATILPEVGHQVAARVRRLIGLYEERMRTAAN
jgi:hypothetical protein